VSAGEILTPPCKSRWASIRAADAGRGPEEGYDDRFDSGAKRALIGASCGVRERESRSVPCVQPGTPERKLGERRSTERTAGQPQPTQMVRRPDKIATKPRWLLPVGDRKSGSGAFRGPKLPRRLIWLVRTTPAGGPSVWSARIMPARQRSRFREIKTRFLPPDRKTIGGRPRIHSRTFTLNSHRQSSHGRQGTRFDSFQDSIRIL
jgi:hypothetical protein